MSEFVESVQTKAEAEVLRQQIGTVNVPVGAEGWMKFVGKGGAVFMQPPVIKKLSPEEVAKRKQEREERDAQRDAEAKSLGVEPRREGETRRAFIKRISVARDKVKLEERKQAEKDRAEKRLEKVRAEQERLKKLEEELESKAN